MKPAYSRETAVNKQIAAKSNLAMKQALMLLKDVRTTFFVFKGKRRLKEGGYFKLN